VEYFKIVTFPKITGSRGNLTFLERGTHVPFAIERVFYITDVPNGAERGGHAHKTLHEIIIALSGSFDVELTDGSTNTRVQLSQPEKGLYIKPLVWRELRNFSTGSICMVLTSAGFDEAEYYRDYKGFLAAKREASEVPPCNCEATDRGRRE
jgi:hypothetical protein